MRHKIYKFIFHFQKNNNISNEEFESNRNMRSRVIDSLVQYVDNLSISDMESIRAQSSMLAMLTSQTDEITRNSAVFFVPKKLN